MVACVVFNMEGQEGNLNNSSSRKETANNSELAQIIRQCVREEIDIQRSGRNGNVGLLNRTRELIGNASRSASEDLARFVSTSNPATGRPSTSSSTLSSGQSSSCLSSMRQTSFNTVKRGNPSHPWRISSNKKKKKGNQKVQLHPKEIHLLDMPNVDSAEGKSKCADSYVISDEMVLLKGFVELGTEQKEDEIRNSITELLVQRFPLTEPDNFDFVKRERNRLTIPLVPPTMQWDYKHIKELCGQGKLYVRLNVPKESIEAAVVKKESHVISMVIDDDEKSQSRIQSKAKSETEQSQSQVDALKELAPFASEDLINHALFEFPEIESAADALLTMNDNNNDETNMCNNSCKANENLSLPEIVEKLKKQLDGKIKKITIDEADLMNDAIAFYKSYQFDPHCPIRVSYDNQPAIDSGGVLRQFFTNLFEEFANGVSLTLFEGENDCKLPSYQPQAVMSGMLELVGKIVAHSIAQGGPGFPCLALPCYYYLVTGDLMCAMAYCSCWDIPDPVSRNIVLKIMDATTEEEIEELRNDEEVLCLLCHCGETSILKMATKPKVIQSIVLYEVLGKRKAAGLDQLQKGLNTLGVLSEMQRNPQLFECLFVRDHATLTPAVMKKLFTFPDVLTEKMNLSKSMLEQFIDQSSDDTLALLMQFCTGSKTLPPIQNFHVTVDFHAENYIFASTCLFSLQLPYFSSYGLFEVALLSAISSLGKSFTAV